MTGRVTSTSFVGREDELGRLQQALQSAAAGQPGTLLIAGEAGIGKTRLVREFAGRVGGEAQVLLGSCLQLSGGGLPYGPIVDALRPLARDLDPADLEELLGPTPYDLAPLLPGATPPPRRLAEPVSEFAQARLFELLLRFLDRLGRRRPVVLVVEDAHWADQSSLDLLVFLIRMAHQERLLVVVTYRSDELHPQHPLRTALAELDRSWHLEHLELARFTRAQLATLVGGILGHPPSPAAVQRIFTRSGGNAFLAEELLAVEASSQPGQTLPLRLQGMLLARIATLPADTTQVLRVVATVGRPAEHRLLAAASQLPEARLVAAVREAVDRQLLVANHDTYTFRHVLLLEAVYGELLPGERRLLHAAVAQALSEEPRPGALRQVSAELAHHWDLIGDHPRTLTASIAAARAAAEVYGFSEADRHYERALNLWGQVPEAHQQAGLALSELRLEAADAALWVGAVDRAVALMRPALADVGATLEPARAAVLHIRLADFLREAGDVKAALAAYEEAYRLVADEAPSAEKARVVAVRAAMLMWEGQYQASCVHCEQAIAMARSVGARAQEGHALVTLGCDLAFLGDPDAGIAAIRRALTLAEESGAFQDLYRAYYQLGGTLLWTAGRAQDAAEAFQQGLKGMRELGLELALPSNLLRGELAWALWVLGRWQEAEELTSLALAVESTALATPDRQLLRGRLYLARGQIDAARRQGEIAQDMARQVTHDPWLHGSIQQYLAELAAYQESYAAARSAVAKGLHHLTGSEEILLEMWLCQTGLRAEADAAQRANDQRATTALAEIHASADQLLAHAQQRLVELGHGTHLPDARAYAVGCEAEYSRLRPHPEPQRWAQVVDAWDGLSRPYEAAHARWRQAEALLSAKAPKQAASALRHAHQAATRLEARPLQLEIERLARRARIDLQARPPVPERAPASGPATQLGLTPREREVLEHLMEGRTNRQIGQELFITEKTASLHVSRILAKLGAANRAEAAAIAHRLRLVEPNA
jgi:DNA-binding CsgD family transcriptional regulator/tetratricopeptide (TPR) repeat protein